MVVKPVEKMLGTVQMMAHILSAVRPQTLEAEYGYNSEQEHELQTLVTTPDMSEAEILEVTFVKFGILVNKFMKQSQAEEMDLAALANDEESKGVLQDIMGIGQEQNTGNLVGCAPDLCLCGKVVPQLPVAEDVLDTWQLNVWAMPIEDQTKVVRYFMFDHQDSTGRIWVDVNTFFKFQDAVRMQYVESNPYHNYTHAVDVVASVFRVFTRLRCREWLSDIDMYALLVSALCHDVGHPGWTTPFLVETRHELAVRYNDNSPLENMHCARLF
jgi:hypothetical protein